MTAIDPALIHRYNVEGLWRAWNTLAESDFAPGDYALGRALIADWLREWGEVP